MPSAQAQVEVLTAIPAETVVRTWNGQVGVVQWSNHSEVKVLFPFPGLFTGSGPWTYQRYQVEVVS